MRPVIAAAGFSYPHRGTAKLRVRFNGTGDKKRWCMIGIDIHEGEGLEGGGHIGFCGYTGRVLSRLDLYFGDQICLGVGDRIGIVERKGPKIIELLDYFPESLKHLDWNMKPLNEVPIGTYRWAKTFCAHSHAKAEEMMRLGWQFTIDNPVD